MPDPYDQGKIWAFHQNEGVDSFSEAAPRLEGLARRVFRLARQRRMSNPAVLNIGVGNGYFEELVLRYGGVAYAVDPDVRAVARLVSKGVIGYAARIGQLPLSDRSLDFVVVSEVLEHLDDQERELGLIEMGRILKPGGYVLGTVPYREDLRHNVAVCPCCGNVFHRWGHKKSFDLPDIELLLDRYFRVETVTRTTFISHRSAPKFLKSVARLILAKMGEPIAVPSIYFVARKDLADRRRNQPRK